MKNVSLFLAAFGLVACGGAAPPAASPAAPPVSGSAAPNADPNQPGGATDAKPMPPPPPPTPTTPPQAGAEGGDKKNLGAATVEDSQLVGALTKDQIRDILLKQGDLFNDCYSIGAGPGNKSYVAKVSVKAMIGPSGTVNSAEVAKSTTKNAKVDQCVVAAFKKMKFPKPKNGQAQIITFPIDFDGMEEVSPK